MNPDDLVPVAYRLTTQDGKEVGLIQITREQLLEQLKSEDLPDDFFSRLFYLWVNPEVK